MEMSFSVCHPNTQFRVAQRFQHHALILRNGEPHKGTLKLLRSVVQQVAALGVLRIDEVELNHQLTTVADAKAQRVETGIELVQSFFGLGVVEKCARPTFGTAQNVAVGEAARRR